MSYRGPNADRIQGQLRADVFKYAGETAVWRKFVSAVTGNPIVGLDASSYYVERTITALFYGQPGMGFKLPNSQLPAGMLNQGEFLVSTRDKLDDDDELVWNGETYRIESDGVPNHVAGTYAAIIKRGD